MSFTHVITDLFLKYIKLLVKSIIDEGFTIRQDYCSRLEKSEKPKIEEEPEVKT